LEISTLTLCKLLYSDRETLIQMPAHTQRKQHRKWERVSHRRTNDADYFVDNF
jgi:hypothetical protein